MSCGKRLEFGSAVTAAAARLLGLAGSLGLLVACGGGGGGGSDAPAPPPQATHFAVSAPGSATVGSALSFTVTALDAANATVTAYAGTVHFSSSDPVAALPADSTLTNGSKTFSVTLHTAGSQSIGATDPASGISGTSNAIDVATLPGSMTAPRQGHTATLLGDGKVLITGGLNASGVLASAEIFNPTTSTFSAVGNMETTRVGHTAVLLSDGRVLVAGGGTVTAELFSPATNTFAPTGSMAFARQGHTATVLQDGRVLLAGGGTITAEIFDPKSGQFSVAGDMSANRAYHVAVLLPGGEVVFAGGTDTSGTALGELFDPATSSFTPTANGGTQALNLGAALLEDGRVLLAGGEVSEYISGGSTRCCLYAEFSVGLAMLYDSGGKGFSAGAAMTASRSNLTATLLGSGDVLIAGGETITSTRRGSVELTSHQPLASAELFNPATGSFLATGTMATARTGHTATLLSDGHVLVAGGAATGTVLASAELYDPGTAAFTTVGSGAAAAGVSGQ